VLADRKCDTLLSSLQNCRPPKIQAHHLAFTRAARGTRGIPDVFMIPPAPETGEDAPARAPAFGILILCTGNSARSQVAEALLANLGGARFRIASAGTHPARAINPGAIAVLRDHGIDWTGRVPKTIEDVATESWDLVITVCDNARESCPIFPQRTATVHWGMPDPAAIEDPDERRLAFVETARVLRSRVERLVALPVERLGKGELTERAGAIGGAP
jgi:arsenate reductase (thioredoxin)